MARASEFLEELTEQHKSLKSWLREVEDRIANATEILSRLKTSWQKELDKYVAHLLPDLSESSVDRANKKFPEITSRAVRQLVEQERASIINQIALLPPPESYSADAYDTLVRERQREVATLKTVEEAFLQLTNISGLESLIACRYGTPDHTHRWYQLRYYRDWKRADEILEELGQERWDVVIYQYETGREVVRVSKVAIQKLDEQIAHIEDCRQRAVSLAAALDTVPDAVLEMFRVKLRATIESNAAHRPAQVRAAARQIARQEAQLAQLREEREKVAEKMTRLQELRDKVTSSRRKSVPDEYLAHVRKDNARASRTVYVHDHDTWLIEYLYYNTMLDTLNHQPSESGSQRDYTGSAHAPRYDSHPNTDRYGSVS